MPYLIDSDVLIDQGSRNKNRAKAHGKKACRGYRQAG
jgi:hypothetical protein